MAPHRHHQGRSRWAQRPGCSSCCGPCPVGGLVKQPQVLGGDPRRGHLPVGVACVRPSILVDAAPTKPGCGESDGSQLPSVGTPAAAVGFGRFRHRLVALPVRVPEPLRPRGCWTVTPRSGVATTPQEPFDRWSVWSQRNQRGLSPPSRAAPEAPPTSLSVAASSPRLGGSQPCPHRRPWRRRS